MAQLNQISKFYNLLIYNLRNFNHLKFITKQKKKNNLFLLKKS